MTKLLEETYLKPDKLLEEEQNRLALALMQLIDTTSAQEASSDPVSVPSCGKRWGFGCLKGLITVPDDFDATPEDFEDYITDAKCVPALVM